jgi:hypothetical protein
MNAGEMAAVVNELFDTEMKGISGLRSAAYRKGFFQGLLSVADSEDFCCPLAMGSAKADAWSFGFWDGQRSMKIDMTTRGL